MCFLKQRSRKGCAFSYRLMDFNFNRNPYISFLREWFLKLVGLGEKFHQLKADFAGKITCPREQKVEEECVLSKREF